MDICPDCGPKGNWAFGLVYHKDYIHVRIRNRSGLSVENVGSIVKRTFKGVIPGTLPKKKKR